MRGAILSILLALAGAVEPARILCFFPMAAVSHHFFFRPIIEELANRGHDVVYLTGLPYKDEVPPNVTQKSIAEFVPPLQAMFDPIKFSEQFVLTQMADWYSAGERMGHDFLGNPIVQEMIHSKTERFDVIICQTALIQEFNAGLAHRFGAIAIELSSLGDYSWINELSGLTNNPSYQVDAFSESTHEMSFQQRLESSLLLAVTTVMHYFYLHRMQKVMDRYINGYPGWESRPSIAQLLFNKSLILTNSDPAMGYPAPSAPHLKTVGGVHVRPPKPLPKDIQQFMDESEHGVIYMSLGTNVNFSKIASGKIREEFLSVFSSLPQKVLLKWESDEPINLPNLRVSKFFPQQGILAHRKCVLFITHGGYLSTSEAITNGVPLVGIPFYSDQPRNMVMVEALGLGRMLRYTNLTRESIGWTVRDVVNNPRYKMEATKRSQMLKDRRQSPLDEAVYWIEHSIKYPYALTPRAVYLSFIQLHLIDVMLFLLVMLAAVLFLIVKIVQFVFSSCCGQKKTAEKYKRS